MQHQLLLLVVGLLQLVMGLCQGHCSIPCSTDRGDRGHRTLRYLLQLMILLLLLILLLMMILLLLLKLLLLLILLLLLLLILLLLHVLLRLGQKLVVVPRCRRQVATRLLRVRTRVMASSVATAATAIRCNMLQLAPSPRPGHREAPRVGVVSVQHGIHAEIRRGSGLRPSLVQRPLLQPSYREEAS